MSPPGDRREPLADTSCPPAAQRKQAKRACYYYIGSMIQYNSIVAQYKMSAGVRPTISGVQTRV